MEQIPYVLSGSERIQNEEAELSSELAELKTKIEENEMVYGIIRPKNSSSVPLPKNVSYFRKERELVLKRGLEVCGARSLTVQADIMQDEMEASMRSDYGIEGLPLLMHQYFSDRIQQLVQCKHMHMLRWARFHEHSSTIEDLYPDYQQRLQQIMLEYNDCLQRAQRLSVSRESLFNNDTNAALSLKKEDVFIYLRWLVCHFHSTQRFNQYMRILQWLPLSHKSDILPKPPTQENEDFPSARIPSKYQDETFLTEPSSGLFSPTQKKSVVIESPKVKIRSPPAINPTIPSTNPLPVSQMSLAHAAGGGGITSDGSESSLPLHSTDLNTFRAQLAFLTYIYGIDINVQKMSTSADEMELYAAVNRKFRSVFPRQEQMRTYKTYDTVEIGKENWGADHSSHALLKESNWVDFIKIKPEKDPDMEYKKTELEKRKNVDILLKDQARFMQVIDVDKVQNALRQHAAATRDPPIVTPMTISTGHDSPTRRIRSSPQITNLWKKIYTNPELYHKNQDSLDVALQELEEKENAAKGQRPKSSAVIKKRKDSYDYKDTIQLLGLDEGEQDGNDPASIQGAYISFLQLRHLRIRDLQRTCLSILNYFRSVERTLTINDGGLSLQGGKQVKTGQNHRKSNIDGSQGGGGGLGSHHYQHYTPRDFKISETEFMEFSEVENHDDFYSYEEERVHVQDQRGYYIMYNSALDDFKKLEKELMMIVTHFIEKDKEMRNPRNNSARKRQEQEAGDFDVGSYSHQEVDRFGVLLDLWTNEAAFLESKKDLFDCYYEAYNHVFDRDEKRVLNQEMTNIMHRRPRFDFAASYFVGCYRLECVCLRLHNSLVKSILDNQTVEQREYFDKICRDEAKGFGLPTKILRKHPISVNMGRSALKNIFMLEFHPSLAIAAKLPQGLRHAFWELFHMYCPENTTDVIEMEKKMLEVALQEWEKMEKLGASFSPTEQRDIFSGDFIDDPLFLCQIAEGLVDKLEKEQSRKSQNERALNTAALLGRILHTVTLRHRLLDAACESEVLSRVYHDLAREMGFDESHLFLRFIQFEYASHKEKLINPPIFITAVQEDDSMLDRVSPKSLFLAIHELDESNVGKCSFASRESLLQILESGIPNLEIIFMAQIVHKNALVSAVQQIDACHSIADLNVWNARPASPMDTKSEKSSMTAVTNTSSATEQGSYSARMAHGSNKPKKSPEAFVSIQIEKNPLRDAMLNTFVQKKSQMETILKNPSEMAHLKRKLIKDYCEQAQQRFAQYSLRGQIIAYYNSMLAILEDFENIREMYFMIGEMNEKKTLDDTLFGLETESKSLKTRPRRVLTEDGEHVLNIWFIPHYTEVLVMYKTLEDGKCKKALRHHLRIVAALHDILQYLCAHSRLGSSSAKLTQLRSLSVSADWGGLEGLGTELFEIQKQINHLSDCRDPEQVAEFLTLRRDVKFVEFDISVRHSMRDTFLATSNLRAYQAVTDCMHHALHELSNSQKESFYSTYLNVPEPLEPRDAKSWLLYPYRTMANKAGLYPVHFWHFRQIEYYMRLCMAGLKEVDCNTANGEILGLSLLLEDVLSNGVENVHTEETETKDQNNSSKIDSLVACSTAMSTRPTPKNSSNKSLSKTLQPMESFMLLKSFLELWKQLEIFKENWVCQKLSIQRVNTPTLYKAYCHEYRKDILYPILQSVARRYGQGDLYEGMVSDNEPLIMPKGASELELRKKQLIKLMENQEFHMLKEVRRKINKELNLALAERQREEGALPTDLWKKPIMKETVTINRPHIAEDFVDQLLASKDAPGEDSDTVSFKTEHLNNCLKKLANDVMVRERQCYENYSMYYENVLRVHHQLLYQREQEIKLLKEDLKTAKSNNKVEAQIQVAETSHDLILEVIALRAKIEEMREYLMNQERIMRERVKEEYSELVQDMFTTSFGLMNKFDKHRVDVVSDIKNMIDSVKEATITEMDLRKERSFTDDRLDKSNSIAILEQVHKLQSADTENHHMKVVLMKTRAMNIWKLINERKKHNSAMEEVTRDVERAKKDRKKLQELHQEELVLMNEQLVALHDALKMSETECEKIRKNLDKEMKIKQEKQHTSEQQAQSQKQLMEARRANIDKLLEELEDKDSRLNKLSSEKDKKERIQQLSQDKARKDVEKIRKRLSHERTLKLDAFHRVDELQSQVYDIESGMSTRPQTAIGMMSSRSNAQSRISSASPGPKRPSSRQSVSSTGFATGVTWPANRSLTPAPDFYGRNHDTPEIPMKRQRPKTTMGRLRSQLTEQLLCELEPPDHHDKLKRLEEQAKAAGKVY